MGCLIPVRGKNLYVEDRGQEHQEALLYLHGGPGASCLDFSVYQAKELSKRIRVISMDQRGVLRSDPIEEDEPFGLDDLIRDCEVLRQMLGITQWSVLGHSFGGYVALIYAFEHPEAVKKVLYEAPSFDLKLSGRSLFRHALQILEETGNQEAIMECAQVLNRDLSASDYLSAWIEFSKKYLGEQTDSLYVKNIDPNDLNKIYQDANLGQEFWERGYTHTRKLLKERKLNESLLALIPKVHQPSLLIYGHYDPVCCPIQKDYFQNHAPNGRVIRFENSAHMPRLEEPQKYTKVILDFMFQ